MLPPLSVGSGERRGRTKPPLATARIRAHRHCGNVRHVTSTVVATRC